MADHSLKSATDRSLGELLPHQQANRTQAHQIVINLSSFEIIWYYPSFLRAIPSYMVDSYALLTRSPLSKHPKALFSFDLHVLSVPPAFNLSQDQTLFKRFDPRFLARILGFRTNHTVYDCAYNYW